MSIKEQYCVEKEESKKNRLKETDLNEEHDLIVSKLSFDLNHSWLNTSPIGA